VGINDGGTLIVGQSSPDMGKTLEGTPIVGQIPVVWSSGASGWSDARIDTLPTLDGPGVALGVNDAGTIVGSVSLGGTRIPVIWTGAPGSYLIDTLPLLPGGTEGYAVAVNDNGVVGGFSTDASGERTGLLWRRAGSTWTIEQISRDEVVGLSDTEIAAGEISGSRSQEAWAWTPAKGLIPLGKGAARDANDGGEIVGQNGRSRAVLWTLTS
jgi:hypothetical protein